MSGSILDFKFDLQRFADGYAISIEKSADSSLAIGEVNGEKTTEDGVTYYQSGATVHITGTAKVGDTITVTDSNGTPTEVFTQDGKTFSIGGLNIVLDNANVAEEMTSAPATELNGGDEITEDGVYKLTDGTTGTITIADGVKNVKIIGADGNALSNLFINASDASGLNLFI